MSHKYGTSLLPGFHHYGGGGLGLPVASIPQTGETGGSYLANEAADPANAGKEIRGLILTAPAAGNFTVLPNGAFTFNNAPDGTYFFTYQVYLDGADGGIGASTIIVGVASLGGNALIGEFVLSGLIQAVQPSVPYLLTPPYRNGALVVYPPNTVIPWVHVLLGADGTSVVRFQNVILNAASKAELASGLLVAGILYQVASSTPDCLTYGMEPVIAV